MKAVNSGAVPTIPTMWNSVAEVENNAGKPTFAYFIAYTLKSNAEGNRKLQNAYGESN